MNALRKSILLSLLVVSSNAFNLEDGLFYALENDTDSIINKNNLQKIKYDKEIANSLNGLKVDFYGKIQNKKVTQDDILPSSSVNHVKEDEFKLTVSKPLFDGNESKYEKKLQDTRYNSATYFLKESENKIALEYVINYTNVVKERELLNLTKENLSLSKKIFDKVYKKVNSGYGTKLEFENAKANFVENQVNLNIQKINLKESIEKLKYLVQRDIDSSELIEPSLNFELPKDFDSVLDFSLKNNPSINVSIINLEVSKNELKKFDKNFLPKVDFVGTYEVDNAIYNNNNSDSNEYALGVELNYNLYNSNIDKLNKKKLQKDINEKSYLINKSKKELSNQLKSAWVNHQLTIEKSKNITRLLTVREDIVKTTEKEFDLGLKDLNALLTSYTDLIDTKKDLLSNDYDILINKFRILSSMGILIDSIGKEVPTLNDLDSLDEKVVLMNNTEELEVKPLVQRVNIVQTTEVINQEHSFKDKFLSAPKNYYTINLATVSNKQKALTFINKFNLKDESFSFKFKYNGLAQIIIYGVFKNKKEALNAVNNLPYELRKNKPFIQKIFRKQVLFHKYNKKTNIKIVNTVKTNKSVKVIKVNNVIKQNNLSSFKERFLNAKSHNYSINLALAYSDKKAKKFINSNKLENNAFFFTFGKERKYRKIMHGVFSSKDEALNALNNLPKNLKANKPYIENIIKKQQLYYKYNRTIDDLI